MTKGHIARTPKLPLTLCSVDIRVHAYLLTLVSVSPLVSSSISAQRILTKGCIASGKYSQQYIHIHTHNTQHTHTHTHTHTPV